MSTIPQPIGSNPLAETKNTYFSYNNKIWDLAPNHPHLATALKVALFVPYILTEAFKHIANFFVELFDAAKSKLAARQIEKAPAALNQPAELPAPPVVAEPVLPVAQAAEPPAPPAIATPIEAPVFKTELSKQQEEEKSPVVDQCAVETTQKPSNDIGQMVEFAMGTVEIEDEDSEAVMPPAIQSHWLTAKTVTALVASAALVALGAAAYHYGLPSCSKIVNLMHLANTRLNICK